MLSVYYIIFRVKYQVKSKKISITRHPLFVLRAAYGVERYRSVGWRSFAAHADSTYSQCQGPQRPQSTPRTTKENNIVILAQAGTIVNLCPRKRV